MPNWTDENGFSWFGILECKRCLGRFEAKKGEVPPHNCLGEIYESKSSDGEYHLPVKVNYPHEKSEEKKRGPIKL